MEPFKHFADIYDELLGDQAHRFWRQYFETIVERYGIEYESAADAACGTGSVVKYWADRGVKKVFGTDFSHAMLTVARKKNMGNNARFWEQDLVNFNVPENVDLITCNFNSLNYLTRFDDLEQTFAQFFGNLKQNGYLICDLNSIYHLKSQWGNQTHYLHNDNAYTIWVTNWDNQGKKVSLFMDNFVKQNNGLFAHASEVHVQQGYELKDILDAMINGGFEKIHAVDLVTLGEIEPQTDRYLLIAQK